MPLKHQSTKSLKTLKINISVLVILLCFCDLVAKMTFWSGLIIFFDKPQIKTDPKP